MIEHIFPKESLIGGWYMPEKICDDLITYYEDNKDKAFSGARFDEKENIDKCPYCYNGKYMYGD